MADGIILKQFGAGAGYQYDFSVYQSALDATFARARSGLVQVTGDGSLDQFGTGMAPLDAGGVNLTFTVVSPTRGGMEALRDAAKQMVTWGVQPLIVQPSDSTADERFCWARLASPDIRLEPGRHTDLWQPVGLTFEVPYPRWYSRSGLVWIGAGVATDTEITLVFERVENQTVSDGDTISVTNNGNAPASVLVIWRATGSVQNVGLRRYDDRTGVLAESLLYTGPLVAGDDLYIDTRYQSVQPAERYTFVEALTRRWLTIPPGTHTLEVYGGFSGSIDLSLDWYDEWI